MPPPSSTWWEVTPVDRSEQPTEQAKDHHPGNRPDPLPPPAAGGGLRLQGPGKGGGQADPGAGDAEERRNRTMKAYKGFDKDLQCRGFQYEVGKDYETDQAELCDCGFHACEFPLDVFSYYAPGESRYCEVDLDATKEHKEDSKRCGKKIHIGLEIGLKGIIDAAIQFIFESSKPTTGYWAHAATTGDCAHAATTGNWAHATTTGYRAHAATTGYRAHAATTGDNAHAATTGDCAHAATTGYWAHAATTGYRAHAATTGYRAHAATTGDCAHAATTGNWAHAAVKGENSIACALGSNSAAKGALGCWLCLAEYDSDGNVTGGQFVQVDGEKIKADTYYTLKNGEFVEVEE